MFNWFKKKKVVQPPAIIFELMPEEENISIYCTFGDEKSIEAFSKMLYFINNGDLIPGVQHAVALHPSKEIGKAILYRWMQIMQDNNGEDDNEVVVRPIDTFSVKENKG